MGDLDAIVLPDTEGRLPPDTQVNCRGGMQPFPISALDDVPLLSDAGMPQIEEAIRPFLESEEGKYWPQSGWQVLYPTDTAVLIAHTDPASPEPNLALMSVEYHDGAWMWSGSSSGGECVLAVQPPPGLNIVDWRLDPATPPTPESTSIAVLLTERACASGEPVGDRLRGPQVVVTDTEVLVTFAAEPQGGSHTCPGNPPTPTTIELSGPLGSRGIRDGLDLGMALDDAIGR